jgi:glycolate oxidase
MSTIKDIGTLYDILGKDNITTDETDLMIYSGDLAPMPSILLHVYGMLGPDVVVRPRNTEHLSRILTHAHRHNIPLTPRGAGTTALGSVLPVEGGIVLDLCSMDKIIEFDEENRCVTVETGMEWKRLVDRVEQRGFQIGAYPSSAPSATVGGYIGSGAGGGIGVPKFGTIHDHILRMTVVMSDGTVRKLNPWEATAFVGAEGTLGIISDVTLRLFPLGQRRYYSFGFDSLYAGVAALKRISALKPYFLTCVNKGFIEFLVKSGDTDMFQKELTISVALEGTPAELERDEKKLLEICASGYRYLDYIAEHEWKEKYKIGLIFKSLGPSVMVQEMRIPIDEMEAALRDIDELLEDEQWGIECLGSTEGTIVIVTYMLADERDRPGFMQKFSYVKDFGTLAFKHNGTPFGIGLHGTANLKKIHPDALPVLKKIRARLERKNILNPSKTTQQRMKPFMVDTSMYMMKILPELVDFGLETASYVPVGLIRFGLRFMGGQLR